LSAYKSKADNFETPEALPADKTVIWI